MLGTIVNVSFPEKAGVADLFAPDLFADLAFAAIFRETPAGKKISGRKMDRRMSGCLAARTPIGPFRSKRET